MINQMDYVELGLACADVCVVLFSGLYEKRLRDLDNPVCEAIKQLTTCVTPATHASSTSLMMFPA